MAEIPDDVAKQMAAAWLAYAEGDVIQTGSEVRAWADLLDPQPPSLREQVADVLRGTNDSRTYAQDADDVLAVVADWLDAYDLAADGKGDVYLGELGEYLSGFCRAIELLRGGSDA